MILGFNHVTQFQLFSYAFAECVYVYGIFPHCSRTVEIARGVGKRERERDGEHKTHMCLVRFQRWYHILSVSDMHKSIPLSMSFAIIIMPVDAA